MDKVRVCDLAKKYGIPSKELITFFNDNNYEVKAAQSSVDEGAVKLNINYVRYPMVPLQRSQITPQDMWLRTTYWSLLGQVEFVYPETVHYLDGI